MFKLILNVTIKVAKDKVFAESGIIGLQYVFLHRITKNLLKLMVIKIIYD
jgi:hypothetical protein